MDKTPHLWKPNKDPFISLGVLSCSPLDELCGFKFKSRGAKGHTDFQKTIGDTQQQWPKLSSLTKLKSPLNKDLSVNLSTLGIHKTVTSKTHDKILNKKAIPSNNPKDISDKNDKTNLFAMNDSVDSIKSAMTKPSTFFHNLIKPFKFSSSKEEQSEDDIQNLAAQENKIFPYETLVAATNQFDILNKLGEGGFGPVYKLKGKLSDGREIAVKKLSRRSNQGKTQFINEAKLLGRVQHRNVVNLIGYCAHASEKLLVYEYVPRKSLDKLLFESGKKKELDWKRRFDIISGVARGLLYLHEDSHNCIIHRDIKASNILLDQKWVPKIADFGLARLFPEDQTHVNTRVAGTNGYLAPEYLMHGHLSVKADVFSYGVLVLELVTGHRNSSFDTDATAQNLLDWAYRLYKKGRALEMVDPALGSSVITEQVEMCIKLGLLCTQGDPNLRPTMGRVVVMLSKKTSHTEEPTRPGMPGSRYRRVPRRPSAMFSSGVDDDSHSQTYDSSNSGTNNTTSAPTTPSSSATAEVDPRGKRPMQG
ncbi:unnamed protein product [Sphenostylis stenocarpa]|uniref:Protein kinase domain-containing protein n=1 Tax=Sphenostylis stenocarpa TaxID=92480 RepID=A0AA86RWK9_9FABA|nr:unnamed protein product [Sphenostylis stenocarpa]